MDAEGLDPSMIGVIVGVVAGTILVLVIVIGVIVTCYNQKHRTHAIIVANLRAKRIHVLQTTKSNHSSFRGSLRSSGSQHGDVAQSNTQTADIRIIRAVSRSAGNKRRRSNSESRGIPIEIRHVRSADSKHRRFSDSEKPPDLSLAKISKLSSRDNVVLIPSNLSSETRSSVRAIESDDVTTHKVIPFRAFESPKPSASTVQSPRDLQQTSIVIDPTANMQTTIILDDTSSVATTLPYVS